MNDKERIVMEEMDDFEKSLDFTDVILCDLYPQYEHKLRKKFNHEGGSDE